MHPKQTLVVVKELAKSKIWHSVIPLLSKEGFPSPEVFDEDVMYYLINSEHCVACALDFGVDLHPMFRRAMVNAYTGEITSEVLLSYIDEAPPSSVEDFRKRLPKKFADQSRENIFIWWLFNAIDNTTVAARDIRNWLEHNRLVSLISEGIRFPSLIPNLLIQGCDLSPLTIFCDPCHCLYPPLRRSPANGIDREAWHLLNYIT